MTVPHEPGWRTRMVDGFARVRAAWRRLRPMMRTYGPAMREGVLIDATLLLGLMAGRVWTERRAPSAATTSGAAEMAASGNVPPTDGRTTVAPAVATPAPQAGTPTPVASPAPTPPRDWADSVVVPTWVVAGSSTAPGAARPDGPTHSYVPIGGGRGAVHLGDPADGRPVMAAANAPTPARAVQLDTVPLALVSRVSGSRLAMIGLAGPTTALAQGGRWNVPGRCASPMASSGASAQETGRMGDWVVALAVPDAACPAATARAMRRVIPTAAERTTLAYAASISPLARQLGAPSFLSSDLQDLAIGTAAGRRWAWGVFRQAAALTQAYPPPPVPQLAFVARALENGRWELVWAKYADAPGETVALAGVYDHDGAGLPDAFYVVRVGMGQGRVLRLAADGAGIWQLAGSATF